jgi:3-oxoacyl-[acyl-carrier protein] reductase
MNPGLHNKVVLITAATRGIGKAVALAYGRESARVCVTYGNDRTGAPGVGDAIAHSGGHAHTVHLELTDLGSIAAAIDVTVEWFGGLHVLVANAVRWPQDSRGAITDTAPDTWSHAMRANLEGTVATVRSAMGHLVRSSGGRVVLISSGLSRAGMAGASARRGPRPAWTG